MSAVQDLYWLLGGWPSMIVIALVIAIVPLLVSVPVLGPITRAAGRLKAPTRFMLSDFLWLLIQWQLALAYCVRFVGIEHRDFFAMLLGFLALATLGLWAGSVSFLSRAGVRIASRRVVFILFLLPATLALMMGSTFIVLTWSVTYFDLVSTEYRHELEYLMLITGATPQNVAISLLMLPVIAWLLRRVSLWTISGGLNLTAFAGHPAVAQSVPQSPSAT